MVLSSVALSLWLTVVLYSYAAIADPKKETIMKGVT